MYLHIAIITYITGLTSAAAAVSKMSLNLEIAETMCSHYKNYTSTKTMVKLPPEKIPKVKRKNVWIKWTSCGSEFESSCLRFSFVLLPRSRSAAAAGANSKNANYQTRNGKKAGLTRRILIQMKDVKPCNPPPGQSPKSTTRKASRIANVVRELQSHAEKSQKSIIDILQPKDRSIHYKLHPLWLTNEIVVDSSDLDAVSKSVKDRHDVKSVKLEATWSILTSENEADYIPDECPPEPLTPPSSLWDKEELSVEKVWAKGINGSGVITANIDSGVDGEHPALKSNYVNNGYGWFDPFDHTRTPTDKEVGHGTHTMGTQVATMFKLGVAPGAKWMACLACQGFNCTESGIKTCLQWITCPTKFDGSEEDCSKAPHILSFSMGFPWKRKVNEGVDFEAEIQCLISSGIFPFFATGNSGFMPGCEQISYPATLPNVISVGAVGKTDSDVPTLPTNLTTTSYFSQSRGPPGPEFTRVKPDLSAPGVDIWSTYPIKLGSYGSLSGTSMATPNVAGVVCLMLQNKPGLTYDDVREALIKSCSPTYVNASIDKACGGVSEFTYPNNKVGFGSINAYTAVFGNDVDPDC